MRQTETPRRKRDAFSAYKGRAKELSRSYVSAKERAKSVEAWKGDEPMRPRDSIMNFQAKVQRLERNKHDLESKMREFQEKIRLTQARRKQQNNSSFLPY